ncbi:MAG: iron-sulfur cluster assembly scaffold protein [Candidatus Azambacteria bacterium]|nr:iron-sulfur cluster assembly scaffold protein [Candidatus Azambacteria bacterium]
MDIAHFKKIWEHAQLSPYAGVIKRPDMSGTGENPLCGDTLRIDLVVKNGIIRDAKFTHHGCALSATATSLLLESLIGKRVATIQKLNEYDLLKLIGAPVSPARLSCALLPLRVAKAVQQK